MPSTHNQGPLSPFRSFGLSVFSPRREQVHSSDAATTPESSARALDLESFQKHVAERFHELSVVDDDNLLSIEWTKKLLDAFVYCHGEFRVMLLNNRNQTLKPVIGHLVDEHFERSIKALDICNATRDGIGRIRLWLKHSEIVLCALDSSQRAVGEGQFRRARKALMDLTLSMLDEKDTGTVSSHRNRSFGRHTSRDRHSWAPGHARSLSWSVSPSWSASKQLQSIASNLVPPKPNEIAVSDGLVLPVFTMSCVLTYVVWTLVAAIPCQDRGINVHFSVPRNFVWGAPLLSLHERILEESKKRERKNSNGLLKEIHEIERCARNLIDLVDIPQYPIAEDHKMEVEERVKELGQVCEILKKGLDPLERQVRDVFRTIMSFRAEGLEFLGRAGSN